MAQWQTADARQRFIDLVEAANTDGPQVVLRHEEPVAIGLSPEEYRRLVRQADTNFANLLARSPFAPDDIRAGAITPTLTETVENLLTAVVDDVEAKGAVREKQIAEHIAANDAFVTKHGSLGDEFGNF